MPTCLIELIFLILVTSIQDQNVNTSIVINKHWHPNCSELTKYQGLSVPFKFHYTNLSRFKDHSVAKNHNQSSRHL